MAALGKRIETNQEHLFGNWFGIEKLMNGSDRDSCRPVLRKGVHPSADRGKGDALETVLFRQQQTVAIAARQQVVLVVVAAVPDGTDGVDDVAGGQAVAAGD